MSIRKRRGALTSLLWCPVDSNSKWGLIHSMLIHNWDYKQYVNMYECALCSGLCRASGEYNKYIRYP